MFCSWSSGRLVRSPPLVGEFRLPYADVLVGIAVGIPRHRHDHVSDGDIPELACCERKSGKKHKIRIKSKIIIQKVMIKIEGLSKFFRTEEVETIALNNVSLEVKDGEVVAIMGLPDVASLHC